jgi:CRISPR/Cas system-associated exonuclease Cas4 (RecB family)
MILYADDAGAAYQIDYTPALERELLATLESMRSALANGNAPRDHNQVARCQACGFQAVCQQSLA